MTTTPPRPGQIRSHLQLVHEAYVAPTPIDLLAKQPTDEERIEAARKLARTTRVGREILDHLEADGVHVQLVSDREYLEQHGQTRGALRHEVHPSQTEDGVTHLRRRTVIKLPFTSMLRPEEGALALVHQGTHHVLDRLVKTTSPIPPAQREQHAATMRTLVARELAGRPPVRPAMSIAAVMRTYRRGAEQVEW